MKEIKYVMDYQRFENFIEEETVSGKWTILIQYQVGSRIGLIEVDKSNLYESLGYMDESTSYLVIEFTVRFDEELIAIPGWE